MSDRLRAALEVLVEARLIAVGALREGTLICASPKLEEIFGLESGGPPPSLLALVGATDRERVRELLAASPGPVSVAFEAVRTDGSTFEAELIGTTGLLPDGAATVVTIADVTERRRAEKQLSYLAFLDPLTGLANRALLMDRIRATLTQARRDRRVFGLMVCDLDGFKAVNDTHGHEVGDAVLQAVARRLEGAVRDSDTVARLGGDEFAILLPRISERERAALVAGRIVRALAATIAGDGQSCQVGISVGIATFPIDGEDLDTLVGQADAAMYESKRNGKNRYSYAAPHDGRIEPVHHPFFQWSQAHDLGVSVVDEQHRHLIDLMNQLGEDLKAGCEREQLVAGLKRLVGFTREHFATEEQLMRLHGGWPQIEAHQQQHRRLLEDLLSLTASVDQKSMMLTIRYLQEWLLRHIETSDKPLGLWLCENDQAEPRAQVM